MSLFTLYPTIHYTTSYKLCRLQSGTPFSSISEVDWRGVGWGRNLRELPLNEYKVLFFSFHNYVSKTLHLTGKSFRLYPLFLSIHIIGSTS